MFITFKPQIWRM